MEWNVVTLFPEAVRNLLGFGLLGQAFEKTNSPVESVQSSGLGF
jgi:tRNA G37 N-methylase TrmD